MDRSQEDLPDSEREDTEAPQYYGSDGFAAGLERNSLHNKKKKEEKESNFKSTSFAWAPSQDSPPDLRLRVFSRHKDGAAENHAEKKQHRLRLATDAGFAGGAKAYTSVIDCASFADKLLPQLRELGLNHFYEQLIGPVRFYADIEWYVQSDPTHATEETKIAFLNAFMDCAEESIRSKCKVSAEAAVFRNGWRLSEASNDKKVSFHVTLVDVGHFSSNQLIKQLQIVQDIIERLKAKNAEFADLFKNSKEKGVPVDASPYGKDNCFRLLHCAKKTDPTRTLRPVRITRENKLEIIPDGEYNYSDYVVSHIPDGERPLVPRSLPDLKMSLNKRSSRTSGLSRPSQRTTNPAVTDTSVRRTVSELMPTVFEAIDSNHVLHQYKDVIKESSATALGNGDMVVITAQTGTCPWKTHKTRTEAARILFRKDEIRLSCHDPDCREEAGKRSKREYIPVKYPTHELADTAREILAGEVSVAAIVKTVADNPPHSPHESGGTDDEDDGSHSAGFAPRTQFARSQRRNLFVDDEASGEDEEDKDGDKAEKDAIDESDNDDISSDDDLDDDSDDHHIGTSMEDAVIGEVEQYFEKVVIATHQEMETKCSMRMANFLREVVFDSTQQKHFAEYAFEWSTTAYRYAYDKVNGDHIMYAFNGALWKNENAKESLEYRLQDWLMDMLRKLKNDAWARVVRSIPNPKSRRILAKKLTKMHNNKLRERIEMSNDQAVERIRRSKNPKDKKWKKAELAEVIDILYTEAHGRILYVVTEIEEGLDKLLVSVGTETYYRALRSATERILKAPDQYIQMGLPTPSEFFDNLDEREYLIGFDNGVYDLEHSRFYPRGSVPTDFLVTMSVKYDYAEIDLRLQAEMKEVEMSVYRRIFPDERTREQAQAVMGGLLSSGNPMKKFVLMLGEGDNGKSGFVTGLIKATLGDYFSTVAIQVLTERKDTADGCNPVLSSKRKLRCLALNEGDKRMKLNSGTAKTLTGNDEVQFRNLYKQPI
ncbi:hypothetical protein CYMTET_28961, partial [Cymbomonas tetramitiformis]